MDFIHFGIRLTKKIKKHCEYFPKALDVCIYAYTVTKINKKCHIPKMFIPLEIVLPFCTSPMHFRPLFFCKDLQVLEVGRPPLSSRKSFQNWTQSYIPPYLTLLVFVWLNVSHFFCQTKAMSLRPKNSICLVSPLKC